MNRNVFKDMISESSEFTREKVYWLTKFSGELTKSYFPYDLVKNDSPDFRKDTVEFDLPGELFSRLNHLTNKSENNLFVVLTAGLSILLSNYTGNEDIVIGMPILKQEMEGEFLNVLLALRNRLEPTMELKKLILQVKQTFNEANEHSNYPIERLEYYLGNENNENGSSLFETLILLQNIHERKYIEKINHNMVFLFNRTEQCIEGKLEYNSRLYKRSTVENIVSHFLNMLQNMVRDLNTSISDIDILSDRERETLLETFNDTGTPYPDDKLFHELFEEQVMKYPDNKAVVSMDSLSGEPAPLTYKRLNERANQLAGVLMEKGVGPDTIVGIMVEPSVKMAVCILAVSKAGGAFLPIDPESPGDRIEYQLRDSNCPLLLTHEPYTGKIDFSGEKIDVENECWYSGNDSNPERNNSPQNIFYTIYTSGTSGRPKGGLLTHRNLVNYVNWFSTMTRLTDKDRTILTSSFAYDLGYSLFLGSLSTGGELHIIPKESYINPEKLSDYLKTNGITYVKMTPSLFTVIVNSSFFSKGSCSTLRLVILGGEEINIQDVEKAHTICDHIEFINHYGPTETAIGCIARYIDFGQIEMYRENPTIGKPIGNMHIYILDKHFNLLPAGVPGDLFVGGHGVARGYLNHPELTEDRFIHLSSGKQRSVKGGPFYKTGDLARWMPDGNIQFLGRKDNQVKIRGFRIELSEIENRIVKYPHVKDVVVRPMEDKRVGKFLCAYVVPAPGETPADVNDLKKFLSDKLPDFMIPSHFIFINEIPLTPNGKLDMNALKKIEISWGSSEYTPPEKESQSRMLSIWSEVLGEREDKIGIHDNFFELGGHSLNVMFLVTKIHKEFNVKISLVDVFKYPSVESLVKYIMESGTEDIYSTIGNREVRDYYPLSSAQRRFYLAQQLDRDNITFNIPGVFTLAPDFDEERLESIFKEIIRRQESLRTSFKIINNEPCQIIHDEVEFKIEYRDIREEDTARAVKSFIKPFDLTRPPLLRVGLLNTRQEKILVLNIHHIISDGLSVQVLLREFDAVARNVPLPPLPVQYKDYALWQSEWLENKTFKKMENYWLDTLERFKISRLPVDSSNVSGTVKGAYEPARVEKSSCFKIDDFCARHKMTRFSFLVSLFFITLAKEIGEDDLTIGIPVENRDNADMENIIGVFLNVFLLRAVIDKNGSLVNNILEINDRFINAMGNSAYPYEELYYRIKERYDLPDDELFTILFNYLADIGHKESPKSKSETITQLPFDVSPKYPLTIYIKDAGEIVDLQFVYRTDLLNQTRIKRMLHNYLKTIDFIIENENTMFSSLIYEDIEQKDSLKDFGGEFENEDLF